MINNYSILNRAKYFSSDRLQNYLVLLSNRCIEFISNNTNKIESCGSTGMSEERIKNLHTSDNTFIPKLIGNFRFKMWVLKEPV